MSQYPSYYSTPPQRSSPIDFSQYVPAAQSELLAPARRAAILQGIISTLMLLCGIGLAVFPWVVPLDEIIAEAQGQVQVQALPPGMDLEQLIRFTYTGMGVCASVVGIVLLALCFYVRHGGSGPVVTSLVLEVLILLMMLLVLVSGLVQGISQPAALLSVLLTVGVPILAIGINVALLAAAARNIGRLRDARLMYQAQFQQYQMQQQAYATQAGAYGYGGQYATPPAPAAPQPTYGYGYPQPQQQQQPQPGAAPAAEQQKPPHDSSPPPGGTSG